MSGKSVSEKSPSSQSAEAVSRFYRLAGTAVFAVLLVLLGAYLYLHRPQLYNRTRTDLLEASRQLEIYHEDLEVLVQEEQRSADALRDALVWLREAATLDPHDVAEIQAISAELESWEQRARDGELSPKELRRSYQVMVKRVDRLIRKQSAASGSE